MNDNIINYLIFKHYIDLQFNNNNVQSGGNKKKWKTFQHNGVLFPPEYVKHNVPVVYNNEKIILSTEAEEAATLYAKYLETDYVKNSKFNKNFWNDWKKILKRTMHDNIITEFDKVDFSLIYNYILEQKLKKKENNNKEQQLLLEEKYKYAYVDGVKQPVGNYRIEPPGLFLGRGCHPKMGSIKPRIYPEDIIINIGKEATVPDTGMSNHKWQKVIHDRYSEWLASWKDTITNKTKYVWLGAHSELKSRSDIEKFDLARKLKRKIKTIRKINEENLQSDNIKIKQIATALYFIDKLALRVGNEKNEDTVDTVGVTILRVEHIILLEDNKIKLDFYGKDAVRYNRTITTNSVIYNNIKLFQENKTKDDLLFDKINSNDVNEYLKQFMKNLTAKVFRTYNASNLFQKELNKIATKYKDLQEAVQLNILLDEFNKANAKVALLCNHQKDINKNFSKQIDNLSEKIKNTKKLIKNTNNTNKKTKLQNKLKILKSKRELKLETKNISLGTSKINYIDPRITIAFMKKFKIPIEKIFTKSLQEKFKWALDTSEDFQF